MASHHQSEKPSQRQGPGQIDYDHDMVILKSQKSLGLQSAACIWPLVPGLGRRSRAPGPGPGLRAVGRGPGPRPGALGPGPGPEARGLGLGAREQTRNRHGNKRETAMSYSCPQPTLTIPCRGGLPPPGPPCVPPDPPASRGPSRAPRPPSPAPRTRGPGGPLGPPGKVKNSNHIRQPLGATRL